MWFRDCRKKKYSRSLHVKPNLTINVVVIAENSRKKCVGKLHANLIDSQTNSQPFLTTICSESHHNGQETDNNLKQLKVIGLSENRRTKTLLMMYQAVLMSTLMFGNVTGSECTPKVKKQTKFAHFC